MSMNEVDSFWAIQGIPFWSILPIWIDLDIEISRIYTLVIPGWPMFWSFTIWIYLGRCSNPPGSAIRGPAFVGRHRGRSQPQQTFMRPDLLLCIYIYIVYTIYVYIILYIYILWYIYLYDIYIYIYICVGWCFFSVMFLLRIQESLCFGNMIEITSWTGSFQIHSMMSFVCFFLFRFCTRFEPLLWNILC